MSKEEIIVAIKQCAQELGRAPGLFEIERSYPITNRVVRRLFGSWRAALTAAGLEKRRPGRQEIIAAMKECAETLGRTPTHAEFGVMKRISERTVITKFGSWTKALAACSLRPVKDAAATVDSLFQDWAMLARKLNKLPTIWEYQAEMKRASKPLTDKVGGWAEVPRSFVDYARARKLTSEWVDVLAMVEREAASGVRRRRPRSATTSTSLITTTCTASDKSTDVTTKYSGVPLKRDDGRVYGPALTPISLAFGPSNEMGVVFLFGCLARELGFVVTWMGSAFPDCEAMRKVGPGQFQQTRIEFEYESRNFLAHRHDAAECDLIVCWVHNWAECPLEVLELSRVESVRKALGLQ